mmetsp:Transcript_54687/g.108567  ORF Transcript_54687/g.108567 Transcript_54687/m.108567 type:complete len:208 (+) Transcript_54687:276-899(+)
MTAFFAFIWARKAASSAAIASSSISSSKLVVSVSACLGCGRNSAAWVPVGKSLRVGMASLSSSSLSSKWRRAGCQLDKLPGGARMSFRAGPPIAATAERITIPLPRPRCPCIKPPHLLAAPPRPAPIGTFNRTGCGISSSSSSRAAASVDAIVLPPPPPAASPALPPLSTPPPLLPSLSLLPSEAAALPCGGSGCGFDPYGGGGCGT